jgi:capsular polysaccharide biosynthesis protein
VQEQVVSLKNVIRIIRRRPRILVALSLVGCMVGLGYVLLVPAMSSATSLVLLSPSGTTITGQPTQDVNTDVEVVLSEAVLGPAARAAGITQSYAELQHQISAVAVTPDLLQITALAKTPHQAEAVANHVAESFVQYSAGSAVLANDVVLGLEREASDLQHEVNATEAEIKTTTARLQKEGPTSSQGQSDTKLLSDLSGAAQSYQLQLDVVQNEIAQDKLDSGSVGATSQVLEAANIATSPSRLRMPEYIALGILGGLLVGAFLSYATGRRDRRLRSREGIAAATGAYVLQSLPSVRRRKADDWLAMFEEWVPSVSERARLRRLLGALGFSLTDAPFQHALPSASGSEPSQELLSWSIGGSDIDIIVVALAGDRASLGVAPEIAIFVALQGVPVEFVVASEDDSVEAMRLACAARVRKQEGPRERLITRDAPADSDLGRRTIVTLVVIDPLKVDRADWNNSGPNHGTRANETVLAVSAGYALPDELAGVAEVLLGYHYPISGIVVVDPDPADETTGGAPESRARHARGMGIPEESPDRLLD